jgi:hypothetical protein
MTLFVVESHELFDGITTHLLSTADDITCQGQASTITRRKGEISYQTLSWVGNCDALHQVHPKSLAKGEAL